MSDVLIAMIRRTVPVAVMYLATVAARYGLHWTPSAEDIAALTTAAVVVYNVLFGALEARFPKAGHAFGIPAQPAYQATTEGNRGA